MRFTEAQTKALVIVPMMSGAVSLLGSGILIIMILVSELKLGAPCRRIFFGLCVFDCVYSLGNAMSSLPVPKTEGIWGASGNLHSCEAQGFILQLGFNGSVLYNCSLSMYYLCVIKFGMDETDFRRKIEPFCHLISNIYPVVASFFLLLGKNFNNNGMKCWIAASPIECTSNPHIECIRGKEDLRHRKLFIRYMIFGAFGFIFIAMGLIVCAMVSHKMSSYKWRRGNMRRRNHQGKIAKKDHSAFGDMLDGGQPGNHVISKRADETRCHDEKVTSIESKLGHGSIRSQQKEGDGQKKISQEPISNLNEPNNSLEFDLNAMRTKTQGRSLSNKLQPSQRVSLVLNSADEDEAVHSDWEEESIDVAPFSCSLPAGRDPSYFRKPPSNLTFDLKAMRNKVKGRSLILKSLAEDQAGNHNKTLEQDDPLNSDSRPMTERGPSIDDAVTQVSIQALLYILSFIITWIFGLSARILLEQGQPPTFSLMLLSRIFNPLQGVFNIFIYCRPHIRSSKRKNPEYSFWRVFWLVVKSGGDNNSAGQGPSASKYIASQKIRDRIDENHAERMQRMRKARSSQSSMFGPLRSSSMTMQSLPSHDEEVVMTCE